MYIPSRNNDVNIKKMVYVDIDDEYRQDEETYNRIINTSGKFKWYCYFSLFIGLILTPAWPFTDKPFFPECLFLIVFPVALMVASKYYLKLIKKNFRLIKRAHPDKAIETDTITVYFQIQYTGSLPFSLAYITDQCMASRTLGSPLTILQNDDFDSEGNFFLKYDLVLDRGYGKFNIGPMTLTIRDPFLFFEEKVELPLKTQISVWLNPPPEEDMQLINTSVINSSGTVSSNKAGNGMDFYGIKEYVPGDDIRAISWTKSAAIGSTVLKQFVKDTLPSVFIAIHSNQEQLRGLGFGNTMHRIFRIAAAVIHETRQHGIPIKLAITENKGTNLIPVPQDIPAFGFMTDLLGSTKAADPEAGQTLIDTIYNEVSPGSIILFLSHTLHLDYEDILDGFASLRARGVKIILWVIDDFKQLNFSGKQQKERISPQEFSDRMEELGVDFRIINPKEQYAKDESFREAGRLLKQ